MVTNNILVQAASFGRNTFITALTDTLNFGLTLVTDDWPTGACVAFRLTSVTHTCGAGVLLPLLTMLVLFPSRQTGVGHTLWTAVARLDHQVLMWFAGHLPTLHHRTLDSPAGAEASGTKAGAPLLSIPVDNPLPGAGISASATLGTALPSWDEGVLIP